ncbi:MAG: hypothetical protein K2G38_04795, partial [Clostridia bacterium]|nr:hypothetical protein [Clostridia bacterium]
VNGHHKKATCNVSGEGCDVAKSEEGPHKDADKDLVCDDCGYTEANLPAGYTSVLATEGATTVLKDTFIVAGKLPEFSDWGTAGVYGLADTGADTAANYVEVAGGKVVQVSPGKDKGGKNLGTIVDFGGAKSGVVKGYLEFKASLLGSKWNIVQFYDGAAPKDDNIVFTLRVGEDKETLYYATEKLSSGNGTACDANFKLSPEKDYALEYEFDLSNGTVTVKIGLTTAESLTTILDGKSIGVSSLTGLRLVSGDSGNRLITVDNVAVVNIPASLDVYQTATKAKVTKVNNDLGSTWTSANTATALAAAKTTAEGAIDGATDNAGVDAAYSAYETAVIAALKGEYEARLDTNYPAGSYTTNKSDYDAAIAAAKTAINGVTKINGFDSVYAEHKLVLDAIEDDTAAATADVTVSLKDDEGNVIGTLTVKAGVTITEDALKAKFTVPSGKVFGGFYQEAGLTNAYTVPIDTSAITTDTTLEVYVKFDNKAQGAGHYIINVVNKSPSTASGDELWPDSSVTYVNKDGGNTSANASDFKFDGNTAAVTIVLKVTAGQTITVKVSGFTGSNGNATDVKCTATNATLTSGSDTVEFSATSTVTAQDDGTMVYTVDEGKDTVTLVFKRNIGKTSRVTEFDITVA